MLFLVTLVTTIVSIYSLTYPLPDAESELNHSVIKCGTGKEFKWERTDPIDNDIALTYKCGDQPSKTQTFTCKKGYKAHSRRRQEICNPGSDPNFGIFRMSKDPNLVDTVGIVYFCLKNSTNSLKPCR